MSCGDMPPFGSTFQAIGHVAYAPEYTPEVRAVMGALKWPSQTANSEMERLRTGLNEILKITGQRQDRPWTTLSQIDEIARKALR